MQQDLRCTGPSHATALLGCALLQAACQASAAGPVGGLVPLPHLLVPNSFAPNTKLLTDDDAVQGNNGSVQLRDSPDRLTLQNDLVSLTLQKQGGLAHAEIDVLSASAFRNSTNLLRKMPKGGGCYWNTVPPRTQTNGTKDNCQLSSHFVGHTVVRRSSALVEIKLETPPTCGFQVDFHYVLRASEPGFYFFLAVKRAGDDDLQLPLGQLRLACRLDQDIFQTVLVPDETRTAQATQLSAPRVADFPLASSLTHEVMNAGYRLRNSRWGLPSQPSLALPGWSDTVSLCHRRAIYVTLPTPLQR